MTKVALLGAGLLGSAIGHRLLTVGCSLWVWNRDPARCELLVSAGAQRLEDPAQAIEEAGTVITVLRDGPVTAEVVARIGSLRGACVMPMGTMGISESVALETQAQGQGGCYLEAPVLGSRPEALQGRLLVMAGGDEAVFARQLPLLRGLASEPRLMGAVGTGAAAKLALNQLIASLTHGYSLALRLVQAAGLDVERFMAVLRPSALYAPTVDKKLTRMLEHHYADPNFSTSLLRKDLNLFLREASLAGVNAEALEGLAALLARAEGTDLDGADYSALHELTAAERTSIS
ncbi:3-hydroxyisobutyrate dehydrogenase [Synechococcus sp. RS9909]|uniref:NAD(P)-dependent oxidoreductase n=1 Tax=unclassified Synechococcus TaxID=2626047 RepID=UPI000068F56C|nr:MULTISPECIES: NAD(P)-dependent oxidoreductase [unclassified Synechococcus]EAQ69912.1 possible 3-hydroxyacid dehydrogenase [Synechococcus sp. RS9917]QNI79818.1 3-hydroxyisobutyrate dehydrogenase [Synechococcus sp. RS9909]